jgi:hypothetical protein
MINKYNILENFLKECEVNIGYYLKGNFENVEWIYVAQSRASGGHLWTQ